MNFIAKKYTILMNNEPIDIWIKNNEIKKIKLDLNEATIKQIQSFPTKVVNGANFENNLNFTQGMSKMMSQQLELAISKNDKKTLSRFARSDLIPENIKNNFMEAVNRQNGLRGMLISGYRFEKIKTGLEEIASLYKTQEIIKKQKQEM